MAPKNVPAYWTCGVPDPNSIAKPATPNSAIAMLQYPSTVSRLPRKKARIRRTSPFGSVGQKSDENGDNCSNCIRRNAQELSMDTLVTHLLNDRREEQGETIKRSVATHIYESPSPGFPICQAGPKVLHLEFFMLGTGLAVKFQSADDTATVVIRKESRVVGKVMHLKHISVVAPACQGILTIQKDINPITTVAKPSRMKIHAHPGLPPTPSMFSMAAASSPPNDPARAAALKKIAARTPNSDRLYQQLK
jgi:hypothetical protein